jgi:predicted DNA binding CopG/RHH family protein
MTPVITSPGKMRQKSHCQSSSHQQKTIYLRLPESMIEELKVLANKQDIPYQSLLKVFLAERLEEEMESIRAI